ncbi:Ccs1/ResB-related putative cytochrome C-type biogenesis protein [Serinicoccus hydrothermalis]|uniref:Ccs1/ResB-related putative cytochrome C-type biogenesis protein n=1 Tax=Serinicoccus hydrothermalis TaxID=1758689 RepID=A0A1B1NBR2_9MICO|nr:cytochrome c biogenesis protein ResB [Serinicoccus hydrothermalis]ANS78815.1 Ccs1/ResB-related putative cytochrome C-type biogenesis protein [Serinicoccus hydrothermalis]
MTTDQRQRIEPSYPKDRTALGGPRLGPLGWARWVWRQLTSMRTALILLLLLAVATVPGSVFPQRSVDPVRVRQYFEDSPTRAEWLDRFGMFEVYSSPWFASIYLLLMISLIGCVLPRMRQHARSLRAQPPRAPARLSRMPVHRRVELDAEPEMVLAAARETLGRRRFRLRDAEDGVLVVSAEKGYLKEAGNLLFHIALLGVIVAVAAGHLFGWRGEIIIKEGESWTSGAGTYDTLNLGPLVDETDVPTFTVRLDDLQVEFESEAQGAQFGQPRIFEGLATVERAGEEPRQRSFGVNNPLSVDGTSLYLLGNGYAPVVTVRDDAGDILFSDAVTFLPQDNTYGSDGVIKVPAADPGLGFAGGFLPTLDISEAGMTSSFPGLVDPALVLTAYEGDLFPEGRSQSVFSIDTESMDQVMQADGEPSRMLLRPGDTLEIPGDRGTIELEGVVRWGGMLVRHDPGRLPALIFAGAALTGLVLMLAVRRRRVFVRVDVGGTLTGDGADPASRHTGLSIAALPKGTDPGLEALVKELLEQITTASGARVPERTTTTGGRDEDER